MALVFKQDDIPPPSYEGKLTPFSEAEWNRLTPKQQWDTIVALRGPDFRGSETVKWYTTSVIRGKMRKILRVGGTVNTDLNLVVIPSGGMLGGAKRPERPVNKKSPTKNDYNYPYYSYIEAHDHDDTCKFCTYQGEMITYLESHPRFDYTHFFTHVSEASENLGLPVLVIPSDEYAKCVMMTYTRAGMAFLEWAVKNSDEVTSSIVKELRRHLRGEKGLVGQE